MFSAQVDPVSSFVFDFTLVVTQAEPYYINGLYL